MLIDHHGFLYHAAVPWPFLDEDQMDWEAGVRNIETWLHCHVGSWMQHWAWADSAENSKIGVAFRWDQDRLLFLISWNR